MLTKLKRLQTDAMYRQHVLNVLGMFLKYPRAIGYKGFAFVENRLHRLGERLSYSQKVECLVCSWRGAAFDAMATLGYIRRHARCPQCGTLERHRAMVTTLLERGWLVPGARCLDVGGIPAFRAFFETRDIGYVSLSLGDPAMVCMDVQTLGFGRDSFDFILDSHVLEYVPDYRRALRELWRVLRPGGMMLLTEAYRFGIPQTVEFGKPVPTATFMVRTFGDDLCAFLIEAGFRVTRFDYTGRNDASGDYFFFCEK